MGFVFSRPALIGSLGDADFKLSMGSTDLDDCVFKAEEDRDYDVLEIDSEHEFSDTLLCFLPEF